MAEEELTKAHATSAPAPGGDGADSEQQQQQQPPLDLPSPAAVAEEIEAQLYSANGGSVSKDYKAKLRSLVFNLKDANNPDLRARVLQKEIPSSRLVRGGGGGEKA